MENEIKFCWDTAPFKDVNFNMSEGLLIELQKLGYLPKAKFVLLNLGENYLFALLTKATGFELRNLRKNRPPGYEWKGLPVSSGQLLPDRKKISIQ